MEGTNVECRSPVRDSEMSRSEQVYMSCRVLALDGSEEEHKIIT